MPHIRKKTARQGLGQTGPRPRQGDVIGGGDLQIGVDDEIACIFFTTRANVSDIFLLGLVLPRHGASVGGHLFARTGVALLWSSVGWISLFGVHA